MEQVDWHNRVWFKKNYPRHSFILWMAIRRKLMTKSGMQRFDLSSSDLYSLCNQGREDLDNLFFNYEVSKEIWVNILILCHQIYTPQTWAEYVSNCSLRWNTLCKLSFKVVVYYIWRERNNIIFNKGRTSKEGITSLIKDVAWEKDFLLHNLQRTDENLVLTTNWSLRIMFSRSMLYSGTLRVWCCNAFLRLSHGLALTVCALCCVLWLRLLLSVCFVLSYFLCLT